MKDFNGRILKFTLVAAIVVSFLGLYEPEAINAQDAKKIPREDIVYESKVGSYNQYYHTYRDKTTNQEITIKAEQYKEISSNLELVKLIDGENNVLVPEDDEMFYADFEVNVEDEGLFAIDLKYSPVESYKGKLEARIAIDGKTPFNEAENIILNRYYRDENRIKQDKNGHDIRSEIIQVKGFFTSPLIDMDGFQKYPFQFYLSKGIHTIRITSIGDPFRISSLRLYGLQKSQSYQDVRKVWIDAGSKDVADKYTNYVKIQAENTYLKSDISLAIQSDKTDCKTEPWDAGKIKYNYVGGSNWGHPGQSITWKATVPESGLYKILFRYRQNYQNGLVTSRKLYIDGKIPFKEFEQLDFEYTHGWDKLVPSDEKGHPYTVYLEKGIHEITMECTMGDLLQSVQVLQQLVFEMNELYRKVIMITGTQPDIFRDYMLEKSIPDLNDRLIHIKEVLTQQKRDISQLGQNASDEAAILNRTITLLNRLLKDPEELKNYLEEYKNNVNAIASWVLELKNQSLDLDYILLMPPNGKEPQIKANIFDNIRTFFLTFIASFFEEYNSVGTVYSAKNTITVWTGWGRDQASVLKQLSDNSFTQKTGIKVNVKLVQSSLIDAILAGAGPDVAVNIGRAQPVNLAMRNAAEDLSKFQGFSEITKRFSDSAMLPYKYKDGYYAVPNTQSFFMMFYRKDILDELNLEVPQTMEEFYNVITWIQRNNMGVALPYASPNVNNLIDAGMGTRNMFAQLLLQRGGKIYSGDLKKTELDSKQSIEAFKEWTDFYKKYNFAVYFDFYNRFRTGEMPLGIAEYTLYNMFDLAAPEIKGLWGMAPIPGTVQQDGSIDRSEAASGTAVVMLSSCKNKENAFKFIDWWTSEDIQADFGIQMEAVTGPGGRYATANIESFKQLPWKRQEKESILEQWAFVKEIEEIPGGYYTSRALENAFFEVYYSNAVPRDALISWNDKINDEISNKRKEFKLD